MKTKNLLRKAFLLLALVGGINSAWAAVNTTLIDGITLPSLPSGTYEGGTTVSHNGTNTAVVVDANGNSVMEAIAPGYGSPTASNFTWTNAANGTSDASWSTTSTTWVAPDGSLFVGSTAYTTKENAHYVNFARRGNLRTNRTFAYRFTNCSGISALVKSQGNTDDAAACLAVYEVGAGDVLTSAGSASSKAKAVDIITVDGLSSSKTYVAYIYGMNASNGELYEVAFIAPPSKVPTSEILKSNAAVKVGETTLTKDAVSNGYSVAGTTITLSNDITAVSAPTNVSLVKTITYDDESTEDDDVDVTFDGTVTDGYYIGTASIGLTGSEISYTVKVKQSVTPTAELTSTSGTIAMANSYTVIGTTTVTLTGGNLTDGTYDVTADEEGTTISPSSFTVADGSVSQEFTITTSATSAAETVFTFGTSSMGVAAPTYTLTYTKVAKRGLSQTDVTSATTWDWSKAGSNTIELTASTSPTNAEEFLMANLPEVNNDANFNSQALMINTQYPTRGSNNYFQGYSIKFNTTVPGIIDVKFSNTGNKRPYRYLRVNGTQTSFKSGDGTMVDATGIVVPAGEVVIDFYIPDATDPQERSGDVVGTTMCRVNKIVFTPCVPATVGTHGYATFSSAYALDFTDVDGVEAYIATGGDASTVTMEKVTGTVAASTGLVLKGDKGSYNIPIIAEGTAYDTNKLWAITSGETVHAAGTGYTNYVLAYQNGSVVFASVTGDNTAVLPAGSAALCLQNYNGARAISLVFGGITGVEAVEATAETAQKDGKFVINGQLVIKKNGKMYNAAGAQMK